MIGRDATPLAIAACATAATANTRNWDFRVLLDGAEIGEHRFTLKEEGEARELRSAAQYRVRVLLVEAFRSVGWGWGGSWSGGVRDYQHFSSNGR